MFRQLLTLVVLLYAMNTYSEDLKIIYNSPQDNSELVQLSSNIIFKTNLSCLNSQNKFSINVSGSQSKHISGKLLFLNDNKTFIFDPSGNFKTGEIVKVILFLNLKNKKYILKEFEFRTISKPITTEERKSALNKIFNDEFYPDGLNVNFTGQITRQFSDTLPQTFPVINITTKNNNPPSGKIFCTNIIRNNSFEPYLMILNNDGSPLFYRKMPSTCYDFKVHENGLMTYYLNEAKKFYGMDSSYNVIDSFYCGNGYETDLHELRILSNGNALIMSYDAQTIDMSLIVPGGQKNAEVTGLIIQEIDRKKNVIFQWRSWDHFNITDADSVNLSLGFIDYAHGNAIETDYDGNYLLSCRNMSEITKINKNTGDIIWRLGGKNNQFIFTNDPIKFSYQHAIRRTSSGTYILFDNGNFHSPKFSRAVEYRLDEVNRTAELIWEYRNDHLIYTYAMGYADRLPNGNTAISWGFAPIAFTEVNSSNEKVHEFSFDSANFSYRTFRREWNPIQNNSNPVDYVLTENYPNPFNGSTNITFSIPQNSNIVIKVYDVLGKNIKTLVENKFYEAGKHIVNFNTNGISSGVYIYELSVNGQLFTHKMILTK